MTESSGAELCFRTKRSAGSKVLTATLVLLRLTMGLMQKPFV